MTLFIFELIAFWYIHKKYLCIDEDIYYKELAVVPKEVVKSQNWGLGVFSSQLSVAGWRPRKTNALV